MTTLAFALDGDYIELKSLLKLTGLVNSGGEAKVVIDDGQVTVDGGGNPQGRQDPAGPSGRICRYHDPDRTGLKPVWPSCAQAVRWWRSSWRNGGKVVARAIAPPRARRAGQRLSANSPATTPVALNSGAVASRCSRP